MGLGMRKLDGELRWISTTLLVISMVNYSEFHEGLRYEKIGRWIAVNFYNTLYSLSVMVNFYKTLLVMLKVNWG